MSERKQHAEINGKIWEACYPLCAGCPELTLGSEWFCGYEGNGCRFPDRRIEKPASIYRAFWHLAQRHGGMEAVCRGLGPCLDDPTAAEPGEEEGR